jgi:hypothetical protein
MQLTNSRAVTCMLRLSHCNCYVPTMANLKNDKKHKQKPAEASPNAPSQKSARFTSPAASEAAELPDSDQPLYFPPSPTPVQPVEPDLAAEDLKELLDDPEANSADLYTATNSDLDDPTDTIIQPRSTLKIKLSSSTIHDTSSSEVLTDSKLHSKQASRKKKGGIELDDDKEDDEIQITHHSMFSLL